MQDEERVQATVLVLGGRGFIGRYLCTELEEQGALVLIGTRVKGRLAHANRGSYV
ncbi:MAG: NAD-dependent epimerase/dehydratase family protein [Pseudomonadales bacterium]